MRAQSMGSLAQLLAEVTMASEKSGKQTARALQLKPVRALRAGPPRGTKGQRCA